MNEICADRQQWKVEPFKNLPRLYGHEAIVTRETPHGLRVECECTWEWGDDLTTAQAETVALGHIAAMAPRNHVAGVEARAFLKGTG